MRQTRLNLVIGIAITGLILAGGSPSCRKKNTETVSISASKQVPHLAISSGYPQVFISEGCSGGQRIVFFYGFLIAHGMDFHIGYAEVRNSAGNVVRTVTFPFPCWVRADATNWYYLKFNVINQICPYDPAETFTISFHDSPGSPQYVLSNFSPTSTVGGAGVGDIAALGTTCPK